MKRSRVARVKSPLALIVAILVISVTFLYAIPYNSSSSGTSETSRKVIMKKKTNSYLALYDDLQLDSMDLSKDAFIYAVAGLDSLREAGLVKNDSILSIVDFSLSSGKKRLFIIDLFSGKLLFNTFVSHGRNSGKAVASRFSNKLNSFASSLGFYVTGSTYKGEHGYSLRLNGLEKGINDNAFNRGIVMHSAPYVNEKLVNAQGYIGRSLGCPAVPVALHKAIIATIKDGTCLFMYSPDKKYIAHTRLVKPAFYDFLSGRA